MSSPDDTHTITEIIELEPDQSTISSTFSAGECLLNLGNISGTGLGIGDSSYTYIITTSKEPNSDGSHEMVLSAEPIVPQQQLQQLFLTSSNITNRLSLPVTNDLSETAAGTGQQLQFTLWSTSDPENEIDLDLQQPQPLSVENPIVVDLVVESTESAAVENRDGDFVEKNKTVRTSTKTKQSQVRRITKEPQPQLTLPQIKVTQTRVNKVRSRSKVTVTNQQHVRLRNEKNNRKKTRKLADWLAEGIDPRRLERNAEEVSARFEKGCGCPDTNCFEGLSADFVCKHRLNIADLTRAEHDLYLMGVTMATLSNPDATTKHTVRQRLRSSYVFLGQEVCLSAWLYLENCTQYQVKRIRKHLMTNGVTARVHGNQGKKPHNTFPFDSYQLTFEFLENRFSEFSSSKNQSSTSTIVLPPGRTLNKLYKEYAKHFETVRSEKDAENSGFKTLGRSSFLQFIKTKFPHVKFSNLMNNSGIKKNREIRIGSKHSEPNS